MITERFYERMAECLELPSVTPDLEFRTVPGFCSLQAFAMLVALETEFGRPMRIDEFQRMKTLADLAAAVK